MQKFLLLLSLTIFTIKVNAQINEAYFMSHSTLTPDGQTIIFNYDNDLWKVSTAGGTAARLTAMLGNEQYPRVSPDGKWLAFSGSQYGGTDVYIMPLSGGEIKQLTFHEAWDHVDSWSWDSKNVYFTSNRYNRQSGYKVSVDGGTPARLFANYFNTVHSIIEHPNGEIFFNETLESKASANRKRYKGAYNPDLQSYNPKTKEFKVYTSWTGKDFWPTIDKQGNIYFVSDEANGEYNLYQMNGTKKTQLTTFNTSISRPQVSANGEKIVYEKDYQLWVYDVKSKDSKKVNINIFSNNILAKSQDFDVKGKIENFDVSADGNKMAFVSRGKLFASDIKGQFVNQIPTGTGRVMEVKWMADNKSLIYGKTNENGYTNWFTNTADASAAEKQITNVNRNDRDLSFNHDRSAGVYISGRDEVRTIDLKSLNTSLVVKDEIWGFQNPAPEFSPDGEYVVFTVRRNFEQDIVVHHLKSKTTTNLTKTAITETNPIWSPDGKWIYFISDRLGPSYPYGLRDAHIYRIPLEKHEDPYKSDKYAELFKADSTKKEDVKKEDKKDGKKGDKKDDKKDEKKEEQKDSVKIVTPVNINPEGLMRLVEQVGPTFGNQFNIFMTQKDDKITMVFGSNHSEGKSNWWKTTFEPFTPPKTEKIEGAAQAAVYMMEVSGKMYGLISGDIHTVNLESKKVEKVDISYKFRTNLEDEFNQMFHETWANIEENFYSETFHGIDWPGMKKRYAAFLPHLGSRADLRTVLNDMLGELNASHLGFASSGDEEKIFYKTQNAETGIIFEEDKPYTVKYVVKNSPADKKGKDIKSGDMLTHVNGQAVDTKMSRHFYFAQPSLDEELSLRFSRGAEKYDIKVRPQAYSALVSLLYDEWIDNNRSLVRSKGKNRIAYSHMRNMGKGELDKFMMDMNSEEYGKEGLILDLRFNTGGNVHDDVLRFLSQRPYLKWKYREGAFAIQSNFTPAAHPIVLLINEQSLSDAEMTAAGFKELGLGKVIGTETYRWIIFTSGKGLVDGSFYRIPGWGCYTLDGKNLELEGVQPDIPVANTFKDRLEGRDPQLERAVSEIMGQLK